VVITVVAVVPSLVAPGAYPTTLSVKAAIPLFPTWYAPCPWSLWRQSCPSLSFMLCGLGVEMGCIDTILMHDFEAEDQGELSLSVGDYVVVRQVCPLLIWLLLWPDISGKGNCCVMLYIFWWLIGGCNVSW
jgi:hypothetical protein